MGPTMLVSALPRFAVPVLTVGAGILLTWAIRAVVEPAWPGQSTGILDGRRVACQSGSILSAS